MVTLGTQWGTRKNFDRGAHLIFWGLKFNKLLFYEVAPNWGYFWETEKVNIIFRG